MYGNVAVKDGLQKSGWGLASAIFPSQLALPVPWPPLHLPTSFHPQSQGTFALCLLLHLLLQEGPISLMTFASAFTVG